MSNQNDQLATNLVNQLLYYATQLSIHHSKRDKQAIFLGQEVILQRFEDTFVTVGKLGLNPGQILDNNFPSIFQRRLVN